jgi:hypothetical protein
LRDRGFKKQRNLLKPSERDRGFFELTYLHFFLEPLYLETINCIYFFILEDKMAFSLQMYPITYMAKYNSETEKWEERWIESDTITFDELNALSPEKMDK